MISAVQFTEVRPLFMGRLHPLCTPNGLATTGVLDDAVTMVTPGAGGGFLHGGRGPYLSSWVLLGTLTWLALRSRLQ